MIVATLPEQSVMHNAVDIKLVEERVTVLKEMSEEQKNTGPEELPWRQKL
jgi:hypothetical protein